MACHQLCNSSFFVASRIEIVEEMRFWGDLRWHAINFAILVFLLQGGLILLKEMNQQ